MTPSEPVSSRPDPTTAAAIGDLERMRAGLRIIALRALGDADAADEAVQETLARAVEALADGRLADREKLAAYVAGIARHVCAHMRRDEKRTVSLDEGSGVAAPTVSMDPLESLVTAGEVERLGLAFKTLSTADQQLLRLCYRDDRTPADISAELGEPAERVRKRKSRALERLRRAFLGGGHDDATAGTNDESQGRHDHD